MLLIGRPSAVDDAGGVFNQTDDVSGVAYCRGSDNPPSKTVCVGRPADRRIPVPEVDSYTEIEPGKSVAFNIAMRATTGGSPGTKVLLSQEIAYRRVKESELEKDAGLSEAQKLKSVRLGSLSFNAAPGQKEAVTSSITFAPGEIKPMTPYEYWLRTGLSPDTGEPTQNPPFSPPPPHLPHPPFGDGCEICALSAGESRAAAMSDRAMEQAQEARERTAEQEENGRSRTAEWEQERRSEEARREEERRSEYERWREESRGERERER